MDRLAWFGFGCLLGVCGTRKVRVKLDKKRYPYLWAAIKARRAALRKARGAS